MPLTDGERQALVWRVRQLRERLDELGRRLDAVDVELRPGTRESAGQSRARLPFEG
jgi:hypothetical protein